MKRFLLFLVILLLPFSLLAQERMKYRIPKNAIFYNRNWRGVGSAKQAAYYPKSVIRISQCCMAVRNPSTFPILKETTFSFSTTWPGIGCACLSFSPDMREWKSVRTGLS